MPVTNVERVGAAMSGPAFEVMVQEVKCKRHIIARGFMRMLRMNFDKHEGDC